ncbi:MFS transporter [Tsukamurella sputi]|uniref:MFS transporter n=1 Tax=Tsukamurella sputi TaxID=2591848 RepID=A0A5C5RUW8_9ACTN|nr:MFS transporter [Tsukamurella sputi]TWS26303.1 MFS transporter [Tsukamurella sputi]
MTGIPATPVTESTPATPSRKAPLLIAVGALLVVLTNAIVFVLPPLLPVIQQQFSLPTVAETTWLYTAAVLSGGAGFIVLPRMADLYGDRNTTVAASAFLTVGAATAAIGNSYAAILIGSVLIGFGGAAQLLPLGFLRRNLGESGIATGVAVVVIATGGGIVLGMIGGGLIVQYLSLRSFYAILAAACAVSTVVCWFGIPHRPPAERVGRIGVVGSAWMIAWVAALLLALTQGLTWGAGALIPLALGIVGGVAWFLVERRSSSAVFDAAVMRAPRVILACVSILFFAAMTACFLLLVSSYVQFAPGNLPVPDAYGLGFSAFQTGLLMLPFAVTFVLGGALVDRPANDGRGLAVLSVGAVITAAGLAWMAVAHHSPWQYLVGAAIVGLGCSMGYSAGFALIQLGTPEEKAGMATGIAGTFMAVGFALGTAVITADLSAEVVEETGGSGVTVAIPSLYSVGYWLAVVPALIVVGVVALSSARARRAGIAA